ncbi:hypothetical protein [Sphingobium sp. MK2]|uniref:hypothetical protein n=1 Tax=Sphingobium sp. MK2 TaxID=3116540 RepID=UPI0032E36391
MNLYEAFEKTLVDEGKTFPLSAEASITLLPVGGDKARRKFEQMMEPYAPRLKAGGELTEQENKDLNIKFYAEHIILGWSGLRGKDKEPVPYSKEAAYTLLSDKKLERFFSLIIRMASDEASFEEKRLEEDEGN